MIKSDYSTIYIYNLCNTYSPKKIKNLCNTFHELYENITSFLYRFLFSLLQRPCALWTQFGHNMLWNRPLDEFYLFFKISRKNLFYSYIYLNWLGTGRCSVARIWRVELKAWCRRFRSSFSKGWCCSTFIGHCLFWW